MTQGLLTILTPGAFVAGGTLTSVGANACSTIFTLGLAHRVLS